MITKGSGTSLKQQLFGAAITATTIAVLGATPAPTIGGNDDIQRLAIGAAIVLWCAWVADRIARRHHDATREEVSIVRDLTEAGGLLREAGGGQPLALPQPHGRIRAVPADIDGTRALVGVDEATELAPVVELAAAIHGKK